MKVIIAGGRDINDYELVCETIKQSQFNITEVVSGGATGIDSLGEKWARENNIKVTLFTANWKLFGKSAGPRRNSKMIEYVGKEGGLILIWNGESKGSMNIFCKAKSAGLIIYEIIVQFKRNIYKNECIN